MKKGVYLITGCAGFIGSKLVRFLFKKYRLILVDDLSEGKLKNLPNKLKKKVIKKKIQEISNIKIKNLKGIFHLAAQSSVLLSIQKTYESSNNNLNSSLKVFEIAKKFNIPVIYASSSAVYGNLSIGDDVKNKISITSPYAQDKLILEKYAKMYYDLFNIASIGLRFFNVYGPNQNSNSPYSAVIPIFIRQMKKNLPVTINGGYQTRDFIYVNDVIKIMTLAMSYLQKKKIVNVINVGTGKSININNLYKLIKKKLSSQSKVIKKPLQKFDPKKSEGTFNKLKRIIINNNFTFTSLKEGISSTIREN
jgi:UDP-glucose 4-epimerase